MRATVIRSTISYGLGRWGRNGIALVLASLALFIMLLLTATPGQGNIATAGAHLGVASCAGSTCHGRMAGDGPIVRQDEIARWQGPSAPSGCSLGTDVPRMPQQCGKRRRRGFPLSADRWRKLRKLPWRGWRMDSVPLCRDVERPGTACRQCAARHAAIGGCHSARSGVPRLPLWFGGRRAICHPPDHGCWTPAHIL